MLIRQIQLLYISIIIIISSVFPCVLAKTYSPPQSALVIEYSNNKAKVLYQQQANAIRHPASLTKMMTVYMLLEALQSKRIKPTKLFRVSNFASIQMASKLNLKPGTYISAMDCVKALLVKSANDIAVVVAEGLAGSVSNFCQQMNMKAKALGMVSTHFENPSGVPNSRQVTTASDIAKLGLAIYNKFPQYWKYFSLKSFTYNGKKYSTHCKILGWYKGADGAKTGFINVSGFNLWVTAQRYSLDGKPKRLFAVVFGGSSGRERDFKAARLMNKFFQGCSNNKRISTTNKNVKTINNSKQNAVNSTNTEPILVKTQKSNQTISKPKFVDTRPIKQQNFKNNTSIQLTEQNDEVLYELDSAPIDDILEMSGKTKEYFNKLYIDEDLIHVNDTTGEEPLKILDVKSINDTTSLSNKNSKIAKVQSKVKKKSKTKRQSRQQKVSSSVLRTAKLNKPKKKH